ncbi:MAG: TetR/AcrR family transcriptional regulator [Salinisphaeraceae bacterium]|nr:TetR/AcrR family transcriptional regulator [Salinisphaeraceae bacterium]
MRRKPQQQRSEKMLQLILDGALDAVARYGIEAVTTRHIAERSGISVGTLYHYFSNKDDVFTALQNRLSSELVARIRAEMQSLVRKDIGDAVRGVLQLFMEELDRDGGKRLAFARNILHRSVERDVGRVEQVMMEFSLAYTAAHPQLTQVKNLTRVTYILFNSVAFNLIRFLDSPSALVGREELIEGLSDMCVAYISSQMPAGTEFPDG